MDEGQASTSRAVNKEMDIFSAKLPDDSAETGPSRKSKTCSRSAGHLLTPAQTKETTEEDARARMESMRELNAQLEKNIKMARERIERKKADIDKVEMELEIMRNLKRMLKGADTSEPQQLHEKKLFKAPGQVAHKRKKKRKNRKRRKLINPEVDKLKG